MEPMGMCEDSVVEVDRGEGSCVSLLFMSIVQLEIIFIN